MTTVITRYFDSAAKADSFRRELMVRQSVSPDIIRTYDEADGLADRLVSRDVDADTAQTYQAKVASGGVVVMVRAGSRPLRVAAITRQAALDEGATLLDGMTEEVFVRDGPNKAPSILAGNPLIMTKRLDVPKTDYHMANWPIPLISRRKPYDLSLSVFPVHGRMADWPFPLLTKGKRFRVETIIDEHHRYFNRLA